MSSLLPLFLLAFLAYPPVSSQSQEPAQHGAGSDLRLPSGRLQRDEILKADHAKNLEDARALIKLAEDLEAEIEKNTEHVLSVSAVKKTEEIEKAAKRIRARMKRY